MNNIFYICVIDEENPIIVILIKSKFIYILVYESLVYLIPAHSCLSLLYTSDAADDIALGWVGGWGGGG